MLFLFCVIEDVTSRYTCLTIQHKEKKDVGLCEKSWLRITPPYGQLNKRQVASGDRGPTGKT